ncbi:MULTISPECIES: hypothetical protein [Cyanophyceae]|uniref:Uncharacterized protein n=1 Tax=Leptolyngbya subtilissima DQ-A4 TaxID=2933933 RepID=A0ABV0K0U9_9CYAN|nr:hypothetical protein [Nodosilinea sp. FACHB-141]MBD2111180.1 hypothetical protein [Nodosilinea sp. FACHB-141]
MPQSIANQAQEVARLPVATADTLNERGTRALIEGRVSDRMGFSDRPPLVAYDLYEGETSHIYVPTLWVQIPGKEVKVTEGYRIRSTLSYVGGIFPSVDGVYHSSFQVNDPVVVLGTLSVAGDRPVVSEAEIAFGTKEAYLVTVEHERQEARWVGLLFLVGGSLQTLVAGGTAYGWRGGTNLSGVP